MKQDMGHGQDFFQQAIFGGLTLALVYFSVAGSSPQCPLLTSKGNRLHLLLWWTRMRTVADTGAVQSSFPTWRYVRSNYNVLVAAAAFATIADFVSFDTMPFGSDTCVTSLTELWP